MRAALEPLVETLLYEGYALYPYTPGAVKNATPTPFGIVYPPAHARESQGCFDQLQLECVAVAPLGAACGVDVRFLQASGTRHEADARAISMASLQLGGPAQERTAEWCSPDGRPILKVRLDAASETQGRGSWRIRLRLHNETDMAADACADRWRALRHALISTHVVLELSDGRFVSPLEAENQACQNVNTWPVLASANDDTILGAAIVLPDHPELAPQSLGSLFDGTEIEEALLLHLQTLSQEERDAIAAQDPKVREAVGRALTAEAEDVFRLHGVLSETREAEKPHLGPEPHLGPDPREGEAQAEVGATIVKRGERVRLQLGARRNDPYACLLDGRHAVIERIHRGYDDRVYLAVTMEDDPGQQLFRESGRFLWFFPDEVEVLDA